LTFFFFSQLVGDWISGNPNYPLNVAESQGAMIDNKLLIVSGFSGSWDAVTKQVYKLDTTNPNANWVRQDDVKYPDGVSHSGFVTNGQKFYMCGAYLGRKESFAGCVRDLSLLVPHHSFLLCSC